MSALGRFLALLALIALTSGVKAQLVISEFMADNDSSLFDGLGEAEDWIELHNLSGAAVPLAGWKLRDSTTTWTFPGGATLPAGGFLIVFASGKASGDYVDPAGYLHTTFKLDAGGEALALLRPDGSVAHEFAAPLPAQKKDVSYGLAQTATALTTFDTAARILVPGAPVNDTWRTDPAFDDGGWIAGKAAAGYGNSFSSASGTVAYRVLTGVNGTQDFGGALGMDFYVNEAVQVTDLGCFDSGGNGLATTITVRLWRRSENGTPGNFADDTGQAVLAQETFTSASPGTLLEGSRYKPLSAPLTLAPGAYTIAASGYSAAELNGNSMGATPTGWFTQSGGKLSFVGPGRYSFTASSFPETIDGGPANRYAAGTFKFAGPGDPIVRTNLAAMQNVNASALMRVEFTVANPSAFDALLLRLPFDDGCAVWLNGAELARRNAPATLAHDSSATASASVIEILPAANALVASANLLAIQGLNVNAADADFFVGAEITGVDTDTATPRHFPLATPGAPNPATGVAGYVADTQFSVKRGFYETPQTVAITSATPGATIRYTLDGSPPSETTGAVYTEPLIITTTTVLRAFAFKAGFTSTNIDTQTYLFANDTAVQPSTAPAGYPAGYWNDYSNGGGTAADYGMIDFNANFANYAKAAGNAAYTPAQARAAVAESLRALPVISIVTDKANLFDPTTGMYLHPGARGDAWERACSVELLTADGTEEFQADGAFHIMGLSSRNLNASPKLNMMLVFSSQYGANWLRHDFFGPDGPGRLKRIALRGNTRDSWLYQEYGPATYLKDAWAKQAQLDSGHAATRHRFAHVFLNGIYWGLYNPTERPEDHWAETTYGGENEDYDVINLCCGNRLDGGDFAEWNELMSRSASGFTSNTAYQEVQGNFPDGTRNPALKKLLGVDSAINFFINGYYTANGDWPGNFFVVYDNIAERTGGWQFITWDNDIGFQGFNVNANKVNAEPGTNLWTTSPGTVDIALRGNIDYKARLADEVYRQFFHGGAYTTARNQARWNALVATVQPGLYAESARWGDYRGAVRTVQDHWRPYVSGPASAATAFFAGRNNAVLAQMRAAGLYPSVNPPEYNQHGGTVPSGFPLVMNGSGGTIHYTINGPDPRQAGGALHPAAATATSGGIAANLTETCVVRARLRNGTTWSALNEVTFVVGNAANAGELVLTELSYHPAAPTAAEIAAGYTSASDFEFLELLNSTPQTLDLTGCHFTNGIEFNFAGTPHTLLAPGATVLVVANRDAFVARFGAAHVPRIAGGFLNGSNLADGGERLTLVDLAGAPIVDVTYDDSSPWPDAADGGGASLHFIVGSSGIEAARWFALTPNPGAVPLDADGDGRSNFDEWLAGTNAGSGASFFVIAELQRNADGSVTGAFQAVPGKTYRVFISSDLATWTPLGPAITATTEREPFSDPNPGAGPRFYRVQTPAP